jgi:hypothetical protein
MPKKYRPTELARIAGAWSALFFFVEERRLR